MNKNLPKGDWGGNEFIVYNKNNKEVWLHSLWDSGMYKFPQYSNPLKSS